MKGEKSCVGDRREGMQEGGKEDALLEKHVGGGDGERREGKGCVRKGRGNTRRG